MELDCVSHCDAACCKFAKYLRFGPDEAKMLADAGTVLVPIGEAGRDGKSDYEKDGACAVESNGQCRQYAFRPEICRDFRVGSRQCLVYRAEHPEAVKALTPRDAKFQQEYFGWDDSA